MILLHVAFKVVLAEDITPNYRLVTSDHFPSNDSKGLQQFFARVLQQFLLLQELQKLLHTYHLKYLKNTRDTFFGTDSPPQSVSSQNSHKNDISLFKFSGFLK